MTRSDSRQRPNFHRKAAAASAVRAVIVVVSDSIVMILLSETPSCWRYSTSRRGTSASHWPSEEDGRTSVTRYPNATISTTRQTAGTSSHRTSRTMPRNLVRACARPHRVDDTPCRRSLTVASVSADAGCSGVPTSAGRSTGCPVSRRHATYAHVVTATQTIPRAMPASTSLTKWTPSTTRASATVLTIRRPRRQRQCGRALRQGSAG